MNPLRCLAQFIVFIHSQSWTNKTFITYQFLHFTMLVGLFFTASGIYLNHLGYSFPVNEKISVLTIFLIVIVGSSYILLFGKRPYLKSEYKNWQIVYGGIIWLLLWIFIIPSIMLLND